MSAVKNGELKPMTAQETSFKSAVLPIVDGRLYALQNSFALGGRASAYPANAEGYSVCNCYLLKEGNRAVLLDSGLTVHAESLISQVASLIDPGTRLSVYPLRINEFMSVANVEALADAKIAALTSYCDQEGITIPDFSAHFFKKENTDAGQGDLDDEVAQEDHSAGCCGRERPR